jgi:hypothetical protein
MRVHREGCCKRLKNCYTAPSMMPFPRSAERCDQNNAYYATTENMLRHRVQQVQQQEANESRHGLRTKTTQMPRRMY